MEFDNDEYNPVKQKFYNYKGKEHLEKSLENINLDNFDNINICPYEVKNDGKYPFLNFLFFKNIYNYLSFLKINISNDNNNFESITNLIKLTLFQSLLIDNYDRFIENIEIDGYYEYNCELFLFINITECKVIIDDIYSQSNIWFAIVDEILNLRKVCNIHLDSLSYRFFNNNYDFCILLDENNEAYENPLVAYVGKQDNKLNFTYIFGVTQTDKSAILGPHYYFTNFENAIKNAYELSKNGDIKNKSGIVRFALFLGNTKYINNFPNDEIDDSEIKQQRLNDEGLDRKYEQLTLRISDHDGKWSESADSCYLGNLMLDNGTKLKESQLFVLKDYNQQVPLSYHYINKTSYESKEYRII
jgi:hypothetical protein